MYQDEKNEDDLESILNSFYIHYVADFFSNSCKRAIELHCEVPMNVTKQPVYHVRCSQKPLEDP